MMKACRSVSLVTIAPPAPTISVDMSGLIIREDTSGEVTGEHAIDTSLVRDVEWWTT